MKVGNQTVLLADDDANDAELITAAFRSAGFENPICVVQRAEEALQYLRGEGQYADRAAHPFPSLMLLDLSIAGRLSGWDVLASLRARPQFSFLPIIVLTRTECPDRSEENTSELQSP